MVAGQPHLGRSLPARWVNPPPRQERIHSQVEQVPARKEFIKASMTAKGSSCAGGRAQRRAEGGKGHPLNSVWGRSLASSYI